ncbi:MAG: DUF4416 family protein [Candidatus Omnitrophota bacterium]|nr:DUF4416 family protein [Candidatus Omnitrophota bacterium]
MSIPRVKLIVGFIFKEESALKKAKLALIRLYGEVDFESPKLAFYHTNYYEKEFGSSLKRKFISFRKLILPQNLARIKAAANKLEKKLSRNSKRLINIDPGYLNLAKLVLASTKDYKHRIYLGQGIYAEITLFYQRKTFTPWEWTYPDYRSREYIEIFNRIREIYSGQLSHKS